MTKKWFFLLIIGASLAGVILASGCAPQTNTSPTPTGTTQAWSPEVPGMKFEEKDLYFDWRGSICQGNTKGSRYYQFIADEWNKRTKGHMKLTNYYDKSIGDDITNAPLMAAGVFELAQINGLFLPRELPLDMSTNIPFFIDMPIEDYEIVEQLVWAGPMHPASQNVFAALGIQAIGQFSQHMPYYFQSRAGVQMNTTADWKGKMMRAPGYMASIARGLGATPVVISGNTFELMQKGMYDIILLSPGSIVTGRLWEVMEGLILKPVSRGQYSTCVNQTAWNALPQYIRDTYTNMVPDVWQYSRTDDLALFDEIMKTVKEKNLKIFEFPDAEWEKIKATGVQAYKDWQDYNVANGLGQQWLQYFSDMVILRNKLMAAKEGHPWNLYLPPGLKAEAYQK